MNVQTRNDSILERYEPFVVAMPSNIDYLDHAPFGLEIRDEHFINPLHTKNETFLSLLQTMDALTFGPEGMPMPRWVFLGGAELPGAIFGFGQLAKKLPDDVIERMEVPADYTGLVPLSMYIAIPVNPPDVWFGHNLASLNAVFPELELSGLASITKALALKCFRCKQQIGATQWDSGALHIHSAFGPLDLITAWTPQHSEAWTLTYRFDVTDDKLKHAMGTPDVKVAYPRMEAEICRADINAQMGLQQRIEAGEQFQIVGRPRGVAMEMMVPIATAGYAGKPSDVPLPER